MDIVLEVLDYLAYDRAYAALWPVRGLPYSSQTVNATIASPRELPTRLAHNNYHYNPASAYFSLEPSKYAYSSSWPRDSPSRQFLSLYITTWVFGYALYFLVASASYRWIFDHDTKNHPKYLKNQVWLEMKQSLSSIPFMAMLTAPCFWLEVQGYSKLYDTTADGPGRWYDYFQFPFFIMFTDCFIYWIHRGLHHPTVYKTLHKPHHKWIMPTPFASHAFHPVDGFAQSIPYHVFPFIFPLQKWAYIVLFMFINVWTIMIHDGEFVTDNPVINGAACHSTHHLAFNYNYGQFTTLWDRLGGSYRAPAKDNFQKDVRKTDRSVIESQVNTMEQTVKAVEGEDDRYYLPEAQAKKVQ